MLQNCRYFYSEQIFLIQWVPLPSTLTPAAAATPGKFKDREALYYGRVGERERVTYSLARKRERMKCDLQH